MKEMTIRFCIPGIHHSQEFLRCWTDLLFWCKNQNITALLHQSNNSDIYTARNECLGGGVSGSKTQKPFHGEPYDYLMWIDSDQVFTPSQFKKLLLQKKKVISGLYFMEDSGLFTAVKDWNEARYRQTGRLEHLSPQSITGMTEPFEAAFNGLGFCLFQQGVMEQLEYPWFAPLSKKIGEVDVPIGEDAALFYRLREKGISLLIDPTVIVGHERRHRVGPEFRPPLPLRHRYVME